MNRNGDNDEITDKQTTSSDTTDIAPTQKE